MLERNRYLVDVPAIENLEFKQEVEQMVKTEKSSTKVVKKKLVDLPKNKSKLDNYQEEIIQMLKDGKIAICNCKGIRRCSVNDCSLDGETWN